MKPDHKYDHYWYNRHTKMKKEYRVEKIGEENTHGVQQTKFKGKNDTIR